LALPRAAILHLALGALLASGGCTDGADRFAPIRVEWSETPPPVGSLPDGVRLLAGTSPDLPLRTWAIRVDPMAEGVRIGVAAAGDDDGLATPTEMARSAGACALINGGFFRIDEAGRGRHIGLLVRDRERVSSALEGVVWQQVRYPTARATIGADSAGILQIRWAGTADDTIRGFVRPFENALGRPAIAPGGRPGDAWFPEWALSAGPVLLSEGEYRVTREEEAFFDAYIPRIHPRSAAGVTADGQLLLVVVDGRQKLSRGVRLEELAVILRDLGAVWAMNLDGGGSSALVVNGRLVNRPAGSNREREIVSAITVMCDAEDSRTG
jgi:exopolysaccharide biosynthesis protein